MVTPLELQKLWRIRHEGSHVLTDEVASRHFLDDSHVEMHNIAVERIFAT